MAFDRRTDEGIDSPLHQQLAHRIRESGTGLVVIDTAAERRIEIEVGALTGAAHGEKSATPLAQRNGYRGRGWQTRAGMVELRIGAKRRRPAMVRKHASLLRSRHVRQVHGPGVLARRRRFLRAAHRSRANGR